MKDAAEESWRDGVSLRGAAERFADQVKWDRYASIQASCAHLLDEDRILPGPQLAPYPDGVNEGNARTALYNAESELRIDICKMLQRGQLLAVGYRLPRLRASKPVWIDAALWNSIDLNQWFGDAVEWQKSTLTVSNFSYEMVRVVASAAFEEVADEGKGLPGKPGSQPRAPLIIEAYKALVAAGTIDFTKALSANYPRIRREAASRVPSKNNRKDTKGLGDETIRLAIGDRFRAEKAKLASQNSSKNSSKN